MTAFAPNFEFAVLMLVPHVHHVHRAVRSSWIRAGRVRHPKEFGVLFETTNPTWSTSGIRQMDPLQWCDIGLITAGHTCGACAIVVLVSVHRSLVYREVVGSRAVVRRKMRCGSDQKGSMCTVSRESVPRWSLRIQPTRSSDALRRESELQCTELCTVVCSS